MERTKNKICPVCGKEFEYKLTVFYVGNGVRTCKHDDVPEAMLYFTKSEKKLAEKVYKEGKVLVKGSDGITRICEPERDKRGRIIERKKKFL